MGRFPMNFIMERNNARASEEVRPLNLTLNFCRPLEAVGYMEYRKILFFLISLILASSLVSCSREGWNTKAGEDTYDSFSLCNHQSLIHHEALQPTYDDFGNVEYWECADCKRAFSDSLAQSPYTGYRYLLPTKYANININNPFSGSVALTRGLIDWGVIVMLTDISISIASLIVTIVSCNNSNADLVETMNKLNSQADKTNEDIEALNGTLSAISKNVASIKKDLSTLSGNLDSYNSSLTSAEGYIESAQNEIQQTLAVISTVENNIQIQELIDNRMASLMDLRTPSLNAYKAMYDYLQEDNAVIEKAGTDSIETALAEMMFSTHINQLISSWGSEQRDYPALTLSLLESSRGMDYGGFTKFTDLLDKYSIDHFASYQEGMNFKEVVLAFDSFIMSASYSLAKQYYALRSDMDDNYRKRRLSRMDSLYKCYSDDVNSYSKKFQTVSLTRTLTATSKTFDENASVFDIQALDESIKAISAGSREALLRQITMKVNEADANFRSVSGIDLRDWEVMQGCCPAQDKTNRDILFSQKDGGMGFCADGITEGSTVYLAIPDYGKFLKLVSTPGSDAISVECECYIGNQRTDVDILSYRSKYASGRFSAIRSHIDRDAYIVTLNATHDEQ